MSKTCDNQSVGVLITDEAGRHLLFRRATLPVGIAPPAGHVDDHGSAEQAARDEVAEEVGLTVTSLDLVNWGWRDNVCRRSPGPAGPGHNWFIYRAAVTGTVEPSAREAHDPRWYTASELQTLADRTIAYGRGQISPAEFAADPGIEPVWVRFLADVDLITAAPDDLDLVDEVANRPVGA